MMRATLKVRKQLAATGDVVAWASIVAGPREFWTITVWRSRHDMAEFMRSGAHDETMWQFSKWLESFWLMRWRPGPTEVGRWKGLAMAQPERTYQDPWAEGRGDERLEKALEHLPRLASSMGADGAVTYDATPYARRRRAEVSGAGGAVVHISAPVERSVSALLALRRLKRESEADPDLLRAVLGMSRPGEFYLLSVWRDRDAARRLVDGLSVRVLAGHWTHVWANEWFPENEFGHWDGLRLRRARQSFGVDVPQAALELGRVKGPT